MEAAVCFSILQVIPGNPGMGNLCPKQTCASQPCTGCCCCLVAGPEPLSLQVCTASVHVLTNAVLAEDLPWADGAVSTGDAKLTKTVLGLHGTVIQVKRFLKHPSRRALRQFAQSRVQMGGIHAWGNNWERLSKGEERFS